MGAHNVWRKGFLAVLAESGNVTASCKAAQIEPKTAYKARNNDPQFAEQWREALESAADLMELEARRRAVEGVEEPIFYKGVEVTKVRRYSDILLIFMLKACRP